MLFTCIFASLVGLYTALAAAIDLRANRIPNYLTVPAALLGLAYHTLAPSGLGPLASLAGFGVGFLLLLLPWLLGGGGMGDVKLLAALGAWLGPLMMLVAFALSMLAAAIMAMAVMAWHTARIGPSGVRKTFLRGPEKTKGRRKARVLPLAVPVAVSTWCLLAWIVVRGTI